MQVINLPTLASINKADYQADELDVLERTASDLLNNIHEHGVYQLDIRPDNTFWHRSSQVFLCDFEDTTFREKKSDVSELVHLDKGRLISMLVNAGVKDPRGRPPDWLFGIVL